VKRLRIGSRGSALALWQARFIAGRLAERGVESEIVVIKTSGDRFQYAQVASIGLKGVFIKEIEEALLDRRVDLAVHSMKDVPTEDTEGLEFPAVCEREDPRDALVSRRGETLASLPPGARVGTSSLRRQAQLRHARPDLQLLELRGNVDTRLRKLEAGEYDAIVLARAGLDRLGLSERISELLEPDVCLPAVGQGALAIETRREDDELNELVGRLNHGPTRAAVTAERALLAALQGGCQVPVGAWGRMDGEHLKLDAAVFSADGSESVRGAAEDSPGRADALGRELAKTLLGRGAGRLLELAGRNLS
jgi:hydroxymethylbilane synthase